MIVVDASVAFKWAVHERDSDLARTVLTRGETLLAPSFWLLELASALSKKRREGVLTVAEAHAMFQGLRFGPVRLVDEAALADAAFDLSAVLDHPVYDCVYLALALRERARLATLRPR